MMMMQARNLIGGLAALVLVCQCAAAGIIPTSAYNSGGNIAPPMYSEPQYYPQMPEAPAAAEEMAAFQQQQQQQQVAGKQPGFASHLRDLSRVGVNSAQRAFQEAKPALNNIRGDFGQVMNRVKQNPHVVKVVGVAKPHVMNVVNRAQPVVANSGKRLNELASKAQQRIQARLAQRHQAQQQQQDLAPGSVYPVPPANADYHQQQQQYE